MDFDLGERAGALRGELRALVRDHVPADFVEGVSGDPKDVEITNRFCRVLAEHGLLCVAWPEEYGGRSASTWEQAVVREEMWAANEPRGPQYMCVNWVGPALMRHGTAQQCEQHLPPISRGEVVWCQGFSEPDAGSDLASVRTFAESDGDGWRISGQKIWTSYARVAQWIFLLARTSRETRKQNGLTVFLVPMATPGIEVRSIPSMIGRYHLNEIFLDSVRVGPDQVLGSVGEGWRVVQDAVAFERVGIARYARCERLLIQGPAVLGPEWCGLPADLLGRWVRALTLCRRARLMAYRVLDRQDSGTVTPGDAAAYRIAVTKLEQETAELLLEVITLSPLDTAESRQFAHDVEEHWRFSQASTVASGSLEMQRILLARTLLASA